MYRYFTRPNHQTCHSQEWGWGGGEGEVSLLLPFVFTGSLRTSLLQLA